MIRSISRTAAFGLSALLLASTVPATAQLAERPSDRLSRYLRELSTDPSSLSALIGAGQAALDVGDGNAALGFFARADERSPRNGQVKAGLARALLMTDNARDALRLFDEAKRLGVQDALIAGDRGLAHDLRGDSKRAQADYALALSRGANDEVTKRYALSLGITGDRDQALKLLDPLLYKRDQGAWRARAFVLAMTGDVRGASAIVHQVMPVRMAQTMDPFLAKLGALSAAQKAAAVHLGEMPTDVRFAANTTTPQLSPPPPAAAVQVRQAESASTSATRRVAESREPRRRPGSYVPLASPPPPRVARVERSQSTPAPTPTPTPAPALSSTPAPAPTLLASSASVPAAGGPAPLASPPPTLMAAGTASSSVAATPVDQRGDLEAIIRELRAAAQAPDTPPARPSVQLAQAAPKTTPPPASRAATKPVVAKAEPAKPDPKKTAAETAKEKAAELAKAKAAAAKKKPEPPKHPARIWVQVAGGANVGALPREWTAVAGKSAELKGKGPWTAKNRATNRLLAGPFKSEAEAQSAVSRLRKAGIGAFQWQSDEGEAVEKLGGK